MGAYITDTYPLVCFLDPDRRSSLGSKALQAFEEAEDGNGLVYVPGVVFVEMLERGESWAAIQAFSLIETSPDKFQLYPLNEKVAKAVSRVSDTIVKDIYDRVIAATALVERVPVLTQSAEILSYDKVTVIWNEEASKSHDGRERPTIGIIAALPKEYDACAIMLDNSRKHVVETRGSHVYLLGEMPALSGGDHHLVLALADMGSNSAAYSTTQLLVDFPTVTWVINVGIAGGVPYPEFADEHVRLGDVVVLGKQGVIQYDFVKETSDDMIPRYPQTRPIAQLVKEAGRLYAEQHDDNAPWLPLIERAMNKRNIKRPDDEADVLVSSNNPQIVIPHPDDPKRRKGQPRIFIGPIASANTLLKNPIKRDALRNRDGIKAVEMEGSGVAEATWSCEVGYFVIRGVSDYCDSNKGDSWQEYASVVAAAYTRALLASVPCQQQ